VELDLWGRSGMRIERRERPAANVEARRMVLQTLASDVRAYFLLRDLDLELEITERA